ncbi:lysophospholipid acyltransferase family protein [Calothrix rhizosoleniae]|uniref:lysophospholipid acyltransferase family protein n=1 Tax=Calothrix rhizosoleniae TaxID=888997 RepID=UPI001F308D36|nr:lysophospholipid acyltransferase family protein [Calothrix rhizosoleniae]
MSEFTIETANQNIKLGWTLEQRDPEFIQSLMPILEWLYYNYFHVQTSGWHHIPENQQFLIVGSHNGGLAAPDMFMMMYDWFRRLGTEKPVYGLMHGIVWQAPAIAKILAKTGAVFAHPKMAYAALSSGSSVLVYPGGAQDVFRPHHLRNQIYFAGRKGFIKLALRKKLPIVPMISCGAHDTLYIMTDAYQLASQLHEWGMPWLFGLDPTVFPIYLGLPWGLALGPLPNIPLPVPMHTRVCPAIVFERYGREAACDRNYVDQCYELVRSQMQQELDALTRVAKTRIHLPFGR